MDEPVTFPMVKKASMNGFTFLSIVDHLTIPPQGFLFGRKKGPCRTRGLNSERVVEQNVVVLVPQIRKEIGEMTKQIPKGKFFSASLRNSPTFLCPQVHEKRVEMIQPGMKYRISDCGVEQIVDVTARAIRDDIDEVVKVMPVR